MDSNAASESASSSSPSESWLNRTVLGAGITSGFGDLTYETTNVILPGFLAVLGIPPYVLGTIEGFADAFSGFMKLGSGYIADRLGHRKTLVVLGYGATALMQIFMALAVAWPMILAGRMIGWLGRGIRGPLRDAIMAEAVTPATRGRAFGFHRAVDSLGAVLGPLLGVGLLALAQTRQHEDESEPFRFVFWCALIPGVLSVLSFAVLVRDDRSQPNRKLRFWATIRGLPKPFRRYLGAVGVFGMGDFAPTLLILAATELLAARMSLLEAAQIAGLLYAGRNAVQTAASYPIGFLADQRGHRAMLVAGYALGVLTAALLVLAFAFDLDGIVYLGGVFLSAGLFAACQDSLESTITADYVALEVRGTAYGVLGSVNGIGDLVSSMVVGLLWTISPVLGFGYAGGMMLFGTILLGRRRS